MENEKETVRVDMSWYRHMEYLGLTPNTDTRNHNVGQSNYALHAIQPWSIWLDYPGLTPFDHDIIKRVLRDKAGEPRKQDYQKIIHICQERIRQIDVSDRMISSTYMPKPFDPAGPLHAQAKAEYNDEKRHG